MKKLTIILIALFMVSCARAQTKQPCSACLPQGIWFSTQAQIDNFQTNYPWCTEIEGDVSIWSIGVDITNLNGLSVLTSIGGYLAIGNIPWGGNFSLTSLSGLDNLTSIGGYLKIEKNTSLTSLTGLEGLTSIGDYLSIRDNYTLTSLIGLEGLTSIVGGLSIIYNDALTNLKGLDNLTSIGGGFDIYSNDALTSLTGMENLASVGGSLTIGYNGVLTSLTVLDNLKSVGVSLAIYENDALTNLVGLDNIAFIGGGLSITSNDALTSLTGLDNIEANTIQALMVWGNPSLSECDILSICDYLAVPYGTVEIHDNATECNSPEEVKARCKFGFEDHTTSVYHINIYPNPSYNTITLSTHNTPYKNTTLTIYNISSQKHIQHQITENQTVVDVSELPQGIYFMHIADERTVQVGKFIKQ